MRRLIRCSVIAASLVVFAVPGRALADPPPTPIANDDAYATPVGAQLNVPSPGVLGNDSNPGGDGMTATLVLDVQNGVLDLRADGSFTYTPHSAFHGVDHFRYVASHGSQDSKPAT